MAQFTFGFVDKTIKGHRYTYFWVYDGTGRKQEVYCGRSGQPRTQRKALETKIKHLEGLQEKIQLMINEARSDLERLPAEEVKKT
jgi:hypothetical protein